MVIQNNKYFSNNTFLNYGYLKRHSKSQDEFFRAKPRAIACHQFLKIGAILRQLKLSTCEYFLNNII